ncbi:phosphatidate cytidylyltransferase [Vagococcus lutrae]|uniref:phosphatidate cytidylyltransferase n=1 Tax=Vagococcus lutrae TaxID=81947 RepID=UPI00288F784C|nr:phosphatidate cytidylyltransferase [Vagococcus lutrae]MDT2824700.1 phosphatidate cytidylyltransferase [Vagococcus lutrae]
MKQRVITAVIALLVFIPIIWYGGVVFQFAVALLAAVAIYELFRMRGLKINSFEGVISIIGVLFLVLPIDDWFFFLPATAANFYLFYLSVMVLLSASVFSKNTYTFEDAAFPVLATLYVGIGFKSFLLARGLGQDFSVLIYGLAIVWSTDIGAYMIGRKVGKNKLAPHVSPNKTIEGSLGGILCALAASLIVFLIYPAKTYFGHSVWALLPMTVVLSVAGQLGDLVESALKRFYGVKDSGKILPGHGGILDRFDSLLFVFPLMKLFGII